MADQDAAIIEHLKANGLYDIFAGSVKKDATVGDVHVPAALPDKSTVDDKKPEDDDVTKMVKALLDHTANATTVAIAKADPVFFRKDANVYISRPLQAESANRLHAWAKDAGIPNLVPPELMHVTLVHSKADVNLDQFKPQPESLLTIPKDGRWLGPLGKDGKAVVMFFTSPELQSRFAAAVAAGAVWDFPSFMPHITLSYDGGPGAEFSSMLPAPDVDLLLGGETVAPSNDNWVEDNKLTKADGDWDTTIKVTKQDPDKRMIFGWASVTQIGGTVVVDKQGDIIPIEELEKAFYDFALYSRQHGDMHSRIGTGRLVECMVFTPEKAALGLVAKNEKGEQMFGAWVGFKVDDEATWALAKAGKLPEFSIGGKATPVPTA